MKKILSSLLIAFLFIGISFAQSRQTREVSDFSGLNFGVSGTVIVEQGNTFSVILEGDEDYLEDIRTTVRGDILVISLNQDRWISYNNRKITAYVTMPEIESLGVSGSGKMIAEKNVKSNDLDLNVSGSGNIEMKDLNAVSLDCGISGSGSIELTGEAESGEMSISGSGHFRGESFRLQRVDVSIAGSGNCRVNVEDRLEARVSGSGDIYYSGNPSIDARVSGSGKVRKY